MPAGEPTRGDEPVAGRVERFGLVDPGAGGWASVGDRSLVRATAPDGLPRGGEKARIRETARPPIAPIGETPECRPCPPTPASSTCSPPPPTWTTRPPAPPCSTARAGPTRTSAGGWRSCC